jgi:hypothetical protein
VGLRMNYGQIASFVDSYVIICLDNS